MKLRRVLPLLAALLLAGCLPGIMVTDRAVIDSENAVRLPGLEGIYAETEGAFQQVRLTVELAAEKPPRYRVRFGEPFRKPEEAKVYSSTFLLTPLGDGNYLLQFESDLKTAVKLRSELPADQAADRYYSYSIYRVAGERSAEFLNLHQAPQDVFGVMVASPLDPVIASWGDSGEKFMFFRGDRKSVLEMFRKVSRLKKIRITPMVKLSGGPLSPSPK